MKHSFMRFKIFMIIMKISVFLAVYGCMRVSCPSAYAALEKSSKKECAMCHVMWLDEFRTEQETLIEWQPGNVLMKDTQGIVSAEEVCYSCHDGYVLDSRHIAWKYNNHSTFKKLPEKTTVPETLTLSNKDQIYCGTCHTPHSGRESESGVTAEKMTPDETMSGPMSFLRLSNIDSALCEACHVDDADFKRTGGHPLHTDKLTVPEQLFEAGSVPGVKKDTVICQTCHRVHGARGSSLTVIDNRKSELCMVCHAQRAVIGTQHDLRVTMPGEINIKGQAVSEAGPCGACHVPHKSAGYRLWARKLPPGNPASEICLSCHGTDPESNFPDSHSKEAKIEGKKDEIKGIGRYSHPNDIDALSEAEQKRVPSGITEKLPFYTKLGQTQPVGTIQCFTCHNLHQWDPAFPENKGGKDAEGDASNSFLRIPASRTSALCVECHRDKRQVLSCDHNLVLTAPETLNIQGATAELSGPCGACHIPHNATDKKLWAGVESQGGAPALKYCIGCHSENGSAKEKCIGENDHIVNEICKGAHIPSVDRVVSKLPLYNEENGTESGDRIMCRTCHDPHLWTADAKPDEISELSRAVTNDLRDNAINDKSDDAMEKPVKNREGDARNSFLRKAASPSPDLCVVCHEDTAWLAGTDHDFFITAPDSRNRQEQTVMQSGQCGACHAVHNSPEKRLLWGGAYGPVAENQHPMNGVCTGCHSEGGIAAGKTPATSSHPAGQLISNIMHLESRSSGMIKIFDSSWKEVNVGDLSCSSCHSFYQWNHRVRGPGPGVNIEGDADTSFLRTTSDKAVCIDCHGATAIWRYTYYHSLQKREMLKDRPR